MSSLKKINNLKEKEMCKESEIIKLLKNLEALGVEEFNLGSSIFYTSDYDNEYELNNMLSATYTYYCYHAVCEEEIENTLTNILKETLLEWKEIFYTTDEKLEELRKDFLSYGWIGLQKTVFDFEKDEHRNEFVKLFNDEFNFKLDEVGYNGCGEAILDIDTMKLVQHCQTEEIKYDLVDDEKYFLVYCSCWQIKRK